MIASSISSTFYDYVSNGILPGSDYFNKKDSYSALNNLDLDTSGYDLAPPFETPAAYISRLHYENRILLFTHAANRTENERIENYLNGRNLQFAVVYLDKIGDEGRVLEEELKRSTQALNPPWLYILGRFRPAKAFFNSFHDGYIDEWLKTSQQTYDYDFIILGDGPTAQIAARTAAGYKRKVLLCHLDTADTMPICDECLVQLKEEVKLDKDPKKTWTAAVQFVKSYCSRVKDEAALLIKALAVNSVKGQAFFVNQRTISLPGRMYTGFNVLLAVERTNTTPMENTITVDALFRSSDYPDKTLVLGNGVLAIHTASLLHYLGIPVKLMYERGALRNFDRETVKVFLASMRSYGIGCDRYDEITITPEKNNTKRVSGFTGRKPFKRKHYKTIVDATEKTFDYEALNLHNIGVDVAQTLLVCNERDQTSVPNIYAVGDIVLGKPSNSKMAVTAARLITERLFGMADKLMDYSYWPVVIRSINVEYGFVGLGEAAATAANGRDNVVVYRTKLKTFDHLLSLRLPRSFVKMVCVKPLEQVVGLHIVGQNVSAMLTGYGLALRKFLTKLEMDATMCLEMSGIHMVTKLELD